MNIGQLLNDAGWLEIVSPHNFEEIALEVFRYQYQHTNIYRHFSDAIGKTPSNVTRLLQIPFLPISFFKTHQVLAGHSDPGLYFESSGTTGMQNSRHYISHPGIYETSFMTAFQQFYGRPEEYVFFCLLPSYLERKHSSLVYMAEELVKQSHHAASGFYLYDFKQLAHMLTRPYDRKVLLLGVTFALLDFAEAFPMDLDRAIVMETGGMKGRREEWTRDEVHDFLKQQWQIETVHSEYGMTELLSQAYSKGKGIFKTPAWMHMLLRDESDPFDIKTTGSGGLNIIDLANIHSCSFIATDDIARIAGDGAFEVLGRIDNSALRGCSLMVV